MNRQQDYIADVCDRKRGQRAALLQARRATHARLAAAEIVEDSAGITEFDKQVMSLKAGLAAHAQALEKLLGPHCVVAFLGAIASHHGRRVKRVKPRRPVF